MDGVTVSYEVSYRSNQPGVNLTLNHTHSLNVTLTNVLPGSQYDITVVTVGVKELRSSYVNLSAYTGILKHMAHRFTVYLYRVYGCISMFVFPQLLMQCKI